MPTRWNPPLALAWRTRPARRWPSRLLNVSSLWLPHEALRPVGSKAPERGGVQSFPWGCPYDQLTSDERHIRRDCVRVEVRKIHGVAEISHRTDSDGADRHRRRRVIDEARHQLIVECCLSPMALNRARPADVLDGNGVRARDRSSHAETPLSCLATDEPGVGCAARLDEIEVRRWSP